MYSIFIDIFIFLVGLIVGSFLNCVIYRIEVNKSFVNDRSICPRCKHILSWNDLIPILSFLILRGKCRYCKEKISWQYPSVEILTAVIFVWIFNLFNLPSAVFNLAIASLLIIVFVYDLKSFIIPDRITFLGIALAFIYNLVLAFTLGGWAFFNPLLSALGAILFFLTIFLISKGRWMGFGDVKLAFLMGLFLGYPGIIVALFFSFLIGAIIGMILILLKKKDLKSEVPFGPFLVIGTFIALFWSDKIITWYLNLFLI